MSTPRPWSEQDYRAIEQALLESEYGRWFLSEYLARNQSEETGQLLDAIAKLQANIGERRFEHVLSQLRHVAQGLALILAAALDHMASKATAASAAPHSPAFVPALESIMEAAEDVHSFLEALRIRNVHVRLKEKIALRLRDIQRACAQFDAEKAKPGSPEDLLRDLKRRLEAVNLVLEACAGRGEETDPFSYTEAGVDMPGGVLVEPPEKENGAASGPRIEPQLLHELSRAILDSMIKTVPPG